MPKSLDSLLSFSSGIWSPKLDARVDQQKYKSAMRESLNVIPYKQGGFTRRPGLQYAGAGKYANTTGHDYSIRLKKFTFSPTTSFMLEFGDEYIRFYSASRQQLFLNLSDVDGWVSTQAYVPGDFVKSASVIYYNILGVSAQIPPATNPNPLIDPTHWTPQIIIEQPTPYNADAGASGPQPGSIYDTDIWQLSFCQINDVIYITHPDYPVYSLTRYSNTHWVMKEVAFLSPALLDQNATNTTIAASATTGSATLTVSAPAWVTATYYNIGNSVLDSGVIYTCVTAHVSGITLLYDIHRGYWVETDVFNSEHVGSTWQLGYLRASADLEYTGVAATGFANGESSSIQALGSWEVHTYGVWSSDIAIQRSLDGGQTWDTVRSVTGRSDRNVDVQGTAVQLGLYKIVVTNSSALVNAGATNPRVVFEVVDSFLYGLVKITAVSSAISATATVVTQLANTNATEYWSEAAWSDYRGYPQAVCAFQQRVIYASSGYEPQRIWGSVTNDIENFALGDQTRATDSFAFDLNAPSRGPIQWLIGQTDLFAGFSGAEWVINSGSTNQNGQSSGAAITPTSINAVEHSSWGSAPNVEPAIVGDAVIYTQRQATSIRQMMFSIYTTKYMSQDLTTVSDLLFASGIAQLCYMTRWRKQSIIWALTKQGQICGMTYDLDQEIFGWSRHTTGSGQFTPAGAPIDPDPGFESVETMDGQGINDDQVWVVVNRIINGTNVRYIERFNPINWEEAFTSAPIPPTPDLTQAFYVDCGVTKSNLSSLTVTALDYLEGRYVIGLADGAPFGPLLVTGGQVTLPNYISLNIARLQIGLPMSYAGQPMRIDSDPRAGNTQGLNKQISNIWVRVYNSCGGSVSNGTSQLNLWVSGTAYVVGDNVRSPLTQGAFQCVVANSGATDPSLSANFVPFSAPTYQQAVPIKYSTNPLNPSSLPQLVTVPTDIRISPQQMPSIGQDPVFIIKGNDALPITVLALILTYDIVSVP